MPLTFRSVLHSSRNTLVTGMFTDLFSVQLQYMYVSSLPRVMINGCAGINANPNMLLLDRAQHMKNDCPGAI